MGLFWRRDEHIRFWGQKVEIKKHGGIKYAGNSTIRAEAYSSVASSSEFVAYVEIVFYLNFQW